MSQKIVFGGGCFWCTEAVFKMIRGVESVTPGYAGGTVANPTYEQVCNGTTGHAEAVQIIYDETVVKLDDLFTVFFATHDPTTLNRQGADVGTQYRSIILYTNEEQRAAAEKFIQAIEQSSSAGGSVVTELKKFDTFYPAEDYHKDYYARNSDQGYCQAVISPKVAKVKEKFRQLLKNQEK